MLCESIDHIAHQIPALWLLSASPEELQGIWGFNKTYQAPMPPVRGHCTINADLKASTVFEASLGNNDLYHDLLEHFRGAIGAHGSPAVVKEYVLKGDVHADDIYCRMYTGDSTVA